MKIKLHKYLKIFLIFLLFSLSVNNSFSQLLKSIVYDFDGLDMNQTDLPEGDYSVLDLSYAIAANPLPANDMIGDRVLKLNLAWSSGYGAFGRGISRFIEFNPNTDMFNFYFYNPVSNNQSATFDVVITDDDNQNNTFENSSDDTWKKSFVIPGSSGWQLFSTPLSSFTDANSGGNGIFDIAFTQNKGMLLMVEFRFTKASAGLSNPTFYLDMINFSDGNLPTGATILNLPPKNATDYCRLGAFQYNSRGQEHLIPSQVESLFPIVPEKKLKYANYFLAFAYGGTTVAKELPGTEVQNLINNGYRPIITWEPMFEGIDRLDPKQPRLNNIINGDYNSYIDQFADKIKSYTDTVVIRFMHEFEGNWYPWSIAHNGQDPNLYVLAFRKVVDRFRARGANNVKWMWCVNSDYFPYQSYNWIVPAYPGDTYVDIIANDIYNNHYPTDLPWWRSFRWQMTESYYYLTKYFPQKPLYMCELGCRERKSNEDPTSESKGAWFARMDKELQSNFHKTRALIFFNSAPDQNWFLNSSASALQSLTDNIWYDDYYFGIANKLGVSVTSPSNNITLAASSTLTINAVAAGGSGSFQKIEFYYGTTKLGEDLTSPYSYLWNSVPAGSYQLTAKVYDSNGSSAVSPIINISVENVCNGNGSITRDVWNNITGTTVSNIPLTTTPSSTGTLTIFEAPQNAADNYGQRVRGYICPPATGNYIFWISSDDNSELWLSTNDLPANKQKIAYVSGWTMSEEWTKYSTQQSIAINLTAGQKYYIEALHKEGTQGDNLAVGWQLPNTNLERPIPGNRLSPYVVPLSVNIASPADNSLFSAGSNIILQATAYSGTGSFQKIEFYYGTTKLGEDLTSPYSYSWNSVPAGSYQLTAKVYDSNGSSAVSPIINISVENLCNGFGSITREVWNNITGTTVSSIPLTTTPSSTGTISVFETPQNSADNYGQRVRGYICPPTTGNYIFWISSDDNSELWLSTNDLPANKQKIAYVSGWTMSEEWTKYSTQQSIAINLTAGQKYYIEALHKEGSQGDNLAVGWQLPNGTKEQPIPGSRLSHYSTSVTSNSPVVTITSPANNASFPSPVNISITANATSSGGTITKVDFFQGSTKVGVDSTSPYSCTWMNVSTGNYALKATAIDNAGQTGTSAIVNISVTSCPTPTITASGPLVFCSGSVTLSTSTGSGYIFQWIKDGVNITGATNSSYTASASGDYQVKVISGFCIAWSAPTKVSIQNTLSASITPGGPTTFCTGGNVKLFANTCSGYVYQWKKDGSYIIGATGSTYTATVTGSYQIQITQGTANAWSALVAVTVNTCKGEVTEEKEPDQRPTTINESPDSLTTFQMKVYPNPNTGIFTIMLNMPLTEEVNVKMSLFNLLGQIVYMKEAASRNNDFKETVELDSALPTGIYMLRVMVGNKVEDTSVILSK